MEGIYETNESFQFEKLVLLSPTNSPGGNYFIKCRMNDAPLYIQPPKCKTKQGLQKNNKKYYCDLMFTHENEKFIQWMERLENHCRRIIYENRNQWFDVELDEHDIENSFTSPLKLFKSGKYYISRTHVPTTMGLCSLKIYNENEQEIDLEEIKENTDIMTILEIQGIKCSTKNFQIEMELKQMMVMESKPLFEKCIFSPLKKADLPLPEHVSETVLPLPEQTPLSEEPPSYMTTSIPEKPLEEIESEEPVIKEPEVPAIKESEPEVKEHEVPAIKEKEKKETDISEFDFDLDTLSETDVVKIKKRNEIYFELYKEAKRKAKIARDLALSSYLEAKHIKNTFLLEDFADDSDSDFDEESFTKIA